LEHEDSRLELAAILVRFEDGWHVWHCEDIEATEQSPFVGAQGRRARELLRTALTSQAWAGANRRLHFRQIVVSLSGQPGTLTPAAARRLAEQPLRVLMESRFSDGRFLDAVLELLGAPETLRMKRRGGLVYDHAGGVGDLPKLILERKSEAGTNPLRAVAFTDSDSRFPGDVRPDAQAVKNACASADVPCHVLGKRAAENYLPDGALTDWSVTVSADRRRRVTACLRLSATQRDHLHMKRGLPNLGGPDVLPAEQQLYVGVTPADLTALQSGGVVSDLSEVLSTEGTLRSTVTAVALRQRDGAGELDALVALIEAEL
jgi:hypothetical protein